MRILALERWRRLAFLSGSLLPLLLCAGRLPAQSMEMVDDRIPDYACQDCHGQRTLVKTNADELVVSLFTDAEMLRGSAHGTNWCVDCHKDVRPTHPYDKLPARRVECGLCHKDFALTYNQSVHGRARKQGKTDAAWCTACHGAHEMLATRNPKSKLHGAAMFDTCGHCHQETAAALKQSAHAKAWEKNRPGAPNCASCHRAHAIHSLRGLSPLSISLVTCGQCHGRESLNSEFKLPQRRIETYLDHYHGLAALWGQTNMPHCASCHGNHRVLPAQHADSSVHPSHLVQTCGQCHEEADANFVQGRIHNEPAASDIGSRLNRWVGWIYRGLIGAILVVLLAHGGLAWLALRRHPVLQGTPLTAQFPPAVRIQLTILMGAFMALAVTGFALRYPNSLAAVCLGGSEEWRRWLHRGAALAMMACGLAHLIYLLASDSGRKFRQQVQLGKCDMTEALAAIRRLLRLEGAGAYDYRARAAYWSKVWGVGIMSATGLMLWLPENVTFWLPRWALDVAQTVHYWEALLACLVLMLVTAGRLVGRWRPGRPSENSHSNPMQ